MKVAIIVDDLDPDRRRRCFWEEQLDKFPDVQYELVSLLQHMEQRRFFNVYAYDVVIFNWCVLDGALMYASDRVQDIVAFYDDHFIQFVQKGGILIMENQPKRWRPTQQAYDVLLPGEMEVVSRKTLLFGSKVVVNDRLRKHPLVQHLPDVLHSSYAHAPDESWFPPDSTSLRSIQELHPTKIYSGAFRRWDPQWLPLLYTEDRKHPVMLVKTDGLGLWVVTTMFLASANITDLIESLICGAQKHCLAIRRYHEHEKRMRALYAARTVAVVLTIALASYALLASGIIVTDIPYGNTFLGNIVLGLMVAILTSALTIFRKFIRRALQTAFNR